MLFTCTTFCSVDATLGYRRRASRHIGEIAGVVTHVRDIPAFLYERIERQGSFHVIALAATRHAIFRDVPHRVNRAIDPVLVTRRVRAAAIRTCFRTDLIELFFGHLEFEIFSNRSGFVIRIRRSLDVRKRSWIAWLSRSSVME